MFRMLAIMIHTVGSARGVEGRDGESCNQRERGCVCDKCL
jgi:hypothetical protein